MERLPPGMRLAPSEWSYNTHRRLVLILTFVAYACYHVCRKPTSIVKSVLVSDSHPLSSSPLPWPLGPIFLPSNPVGEPNSDGWAPFNGTDGSAKVGELDFAFFSCYAIALYAAGILGDRLDLRLFLAAGMIGSGFFVGLFGMGYFWHLHVFGFYLAVQIRAGLFQATGWPSVIAVVGKWLGEQGRGLLMGIWNAHMSVGNIVGSVLEASVLRYGWGWSFVLPAALIALAGVVVFLFLAPYPEDLEFPSPPQGGRDQQAGRRVQKMVTFFVLPRDLCFLDGILLELHVVQEEEERWEEKKKGGRTAQEEEDLDKLLTELGEGPPMASTAPSTASTPAVEEGKAIWRMLHR